MPTSPRGTTTAIPTPTPSEIPRSISMRSMTLLPGMPTTRAGSILSRSSSGNPTSQLWSSLRRRLSSRYSTSTARSAASSAASFESSALSWRTRASSASPTASRLNGPSVAADTTVEIPSLAACGRIRRTIEHRTQRTNVESSGLSLRSWMIWASIPSFYLFADFMRTGW